MRIFCIDLKSFYASVECALRNLDPFKTPLVVADITRGKSSIILAVTPYLKLKGIPSRLRIYELPGDERIIFAKPRMQKYLEYSQMVYKIFLKYLSKNDIHIYSIDEAFLDFTNYPMYDSLTSRELAEKILKEIYHETKITATCGIGENMFMAKIALDKIAKKSISNIGYLDKKLFCEKIWPLSITGIWGIGKRIENRLNKMGIYSIKDIANSKKEVLEREFGIIGAEIYEHSWGIDDTKLSDIKSYQIKNKSLGYGQVLFKDYSKEELLVVLFEMVDEISLRLVGKNLECTGIGISITYSDSQINSGFSRSRKLENSTSSAKILYREFEKLYLDFVEDFKIKVIRIRVNRLIDALFHLPNLFEDVKELEKEKKLYQSTNKIKKRYGKNAIYKASSLSRGATQIKRNSLIGGHNAK